MPNADRRTAFASSRLLNERPERLGTAPDPADREPGLEQVGRRLHLRPVDPEPEGVGLGVGAEAEQRRPPLGDDQRPDLVRRQAGRATASTRSC